MKNVLKSLGKACYRALGYYPIGIQGEKFKVDPYHIGFWRGAAQGRWEPHTYAILSRFLNADSIYCDVGAWIGPTVIYAARKCRRAFCFEPDPIAYRYLCWNIELNDLRNVSSFNVALADRAGMQSMSSRSGEIGDSTTSLLKGSQESTNHIDVLTMTWDSFLGASQGASQIERIDFLKIDIEGGEFSLLPTLKDYLAKHKPVVYLSTHAPFLKAGLREASMRQLSDVMAIYKHCLHKDLTPGDVRELSRGDALEHCRSYLFLD